MITVGEILDVLQDLEVDDAANTTLKFKSLAETNDLDQLEYLGPQYDKKSNTLYLAFDTAGDCEDEEPISDENADECDKCDGPKE